MGSIYSSKNDIDQAIHYFEKGLEVATKHFGEDSTEVINFVSEIVEFFIEQKKFIKAEAYAQKNLKMISKTFSKNSNKTALAYYLLGKIFFAKQENIKALDSYNNAVQILTKLPEHNPDLLSDVYFSMSMAHHSFGNDQKASEFLNKASQTLTQALHKNDLNIAETLFKWAEELNTLNMLKESQGLYQKALEIYQTFDSPNKSQISSIYLALGEIAYDKEDWKKALELFKESEKHRDPTDSPNSERVSGFLDKIDSHRSSSHKEKKEYFPGEMQSWELAGDISPIVLNYWNTGEFCEKQGRLKEALESYQMAAQIYERDSMKEESNTEIIKAKISQIKEKNKIT